MSADRSTYLATIEWQREADAAFIDSRYSRRHRWHFDGGAIVPASPSPHSVKPPFSDPRDVDPEEAFVAAISSCHMLVFLWLAAQAGLRVDGYRDEAVGEMSADAVGRLSISRVTLRPAVAYGGERRPVPARMRACTMRRTNSATSPIR